MSIDKDMSGRAVGRTKGVAALLEVVEERLAHAGGAPFVLLFNERHVRGLRVGVAGYGKKRCAGKESRVRRCSRETGPWKKGTRRWLGQGQ